MQQQPSTGYHLDGIPISYIGVDLGKHYRNDTAFLTTYVMEKILIMYSQTGKVTYSNAELMQEFGCSRRGLHYAMNRMDTTGVVSRVFVDNGLRNHRQGFTVNVEAAKRLLSLTEKDVEHLPRGNVEKHFVAQCIISMNVLKREIARMERNLRNAKTQAKVAEIKIRLEALRAKANQYDQYIESHAAKINRRLEKKLTVVDQSEYEKALLEMVIGLGYVPPNPRMN